MPKTRTKTVELIRASVPTFARYKNRTWFISFGKDKIGAMNRIRPQIENEATASGVSHSEYLIRLLDGLGPLGRRRAFKAGLARYGKDLMTENEE